MEWYYVISPFEDKVSSLRKYVFGPYNTYDEALEISDRVGGEIIPLPTKDKEEAIEMLDTAAAGE